VRILSARFVWPLCLGGLVAGFLALVLRFHHPVYGFTAFFQLDASNDAVMLPELRERPAFVYRDTGGYDGLYYAQLACRPMLRDPALPAAMDNLSYRARRILPSWAAWTLALGNPLRALDAYALLNPLCWLALGALLLAVFPPRSLHHVLAWAGLMFSAGVLASVRLALTDLPALLLLTAALVAWERGRRGGAVGLLAAAALARETSLLAALALRAGTWRAHVLRVVAVAAPLAAWLVYVRLVAGPADAGWGNLSWPGLAFVEKWRVSLGDLGRGDFPLLYWATLLTLLSLTVQAAWLLLRPAWDNLWWRFGLGYVGLMLCLGTAPWEGQPGAAARVLLPLHLAFNALAPRTRAGLALLVLGNLGLLSGVLPLLEPPQSPGEIAAARTGDTAMIARTGSGWFEIEHAGSRSWVWAGGTAHLELQAWAPASAPAPRVWLKLAGFTPRTVTVWQEGRVLWSGPVERKSRWAGLTGLEFHNGRAELTLDTDTPPEPENATPTARPLAYSLSGLRLEP
jgi:hypothetical protein